jgi:hypothetical protein
MPLLRDLSLGPRPQGERQLIRENAEVPVPYRTV